MSSIRIIFGSLSKSHYSFVLSFSLMLCFSLGCNQSLLVWAFSCTNERTSISWLQEKSPVSHFNMVFVIHIKTESCHDVSVSTQESHLVCFYTSVLLFFPSLLDRVFKCTVHEIESWDFLCPLSRREKRLNPQVLFWWILWLSLLVTLKPVFKIFISHFS